MNQQLLETILEHSTGKNSRIHGPVHWAGVATAGYTLCETTPEADQQTVLYFAMLHDSMRESDGHDPEHGARAAELARRLQESGNLKMDAERLATLAEALTFHDKGLTTTDPTVGCCWDADRLNLHRASIKPKVRLMSTAAGRYLVGTRNVRFFSQFKFDWRAIFLNFGALAGETLGVPVYLRFGALPEGGKSRFAWYTQEEDGVSVYHGYRLVSETGEAANTYQLDARRMMLGTDTRLVRLLLSQARPLYIVAGEPVGMGGSGEPVLANARLVEEVALHARFEVLPQHREIKECVDWWRAKRRGEAPGFFPHGWLKDLPGDRSADVRDVWAAFEDRENNEPRRPLFRGTDISTRAFPSVDGTKTARDRWAEWGWDWALKLDDRTRAMYGNGEERDE